MSIRINTPLGAQIEIEQAPKHLGAGVMFHLRMQDVLDTRQAEVFLDLSSLSDLIEILVLAEQDVERGKSV